MKIDLVCRRDSTCAIVVTYNPAAEFMENIAAVRPQVGRLVIVDNGSGSGGISLVEEACSQFECELIKNGANLGIAKALNLGVTLARSHGCGEVLLLDQDSMVGGPGYVSLMANALEESTRSRKTGIVAPMYRERASGAQMPSLKDAWGNLLAVMTSGNLIPLKVFTDVGLHDEGLYIDYVDVEFCLRCRRRGYEIVECPDAVLYHTLGRQTSHRWLGRRFSTTNHSAGRRYYITRNRLLLMRRYWRDWRWVVRDGRAGGLEFLKLLLVEKERPAKLRAWLRGMWDAISNKSGRRVAL